MRTSKIGCVKYLNVNITSSSCFPDRIVRPRASSVCCAVACMLEEKYQLYPKYRVDIRTRYWQPVLTLSNFSKMAANVDVYFTTALNLTKKAGQLIQDKMSINKNVAIKSSDIDFVTETDQEVEKLLIDGLSKQFPEHKFIGEEMVSTGEPCVLTDAPTWIIDPIDGTMNFVHGFPTSCVSVGLFIKGQPEIGIIYNPVLEQLFTAKKGKGAYLNGNRIHVSKVTELNQALLMMEGGTSRDPERINAVFENHKNLIPKIHGMRSLGSAAINMAMVALGAADAYFEFGIHIWDIAAGELIVTEAGGVVIDPTGGPVDRMSRRVLCASSQSLAEQLSQNLVQFYPTPRD